MIRTNYNLSNWVELAIFFLVVGTIVFAPTFTYMHYVFFPVLDGHIDLLNFMTDNEFLEKYRDNILEKIETKQIEQDEFTAAFISMIGLVLGPLVLILWVLLAIMRYLTAFAFWFTRKIGITPMLKLVV